MALDELPGDPYLGLLGEAYNTQLVATIRLLANRRGPASLRLLVVDAQDRALRNAEAALSLEPPILSLACRKGCHHCCWETVGVLAPEAIHLADELRGRLTEVELSALRRRATRRGAQLRDVDRSARSQLRLPCALLKDRCCSAYGHRPLACRWALSPGLQACLDLMVHRTTPFLWMEEVRYQPIQEVWRGLRDGLHETGLDGSLLLLNCALATALSEERVAERYLEGEDVFAKDRLDSGDT